MKDIVLDCGLELRIDAETGQGLISSSLKDDCHDEDWNTAMDAVESLVLAHACAGVDVTARAYQDGLQGCLEAVANNL